MLRLKSDLLPALICHRRRRAGRPSTCAGTTDAALTVVMAAKGYPGDYAKGTEIRGLDGRHGAAGVEVFHAGTRRDGDRLLAAGGRVLNVTARGKTVAEAQAARLRRRSPRSTGPAASTAPTSAGGRSRGRSPRCVRPQSAQVFRGLRASISDSDRRAPQLTSFIYAPFTAAPTPAPITGTICNTSGLSRGPSLSEW